MSLPKALNSLVQKLGNLKEAVNNFHWEKFSAEPSKLLLHAAPVGWVLFGTANTLGTVLNPDIKTKEKKFLIPQDIADMVLNIGLYYLITTNLIKGGKSLMKKGVINFHNALPGTKEYKKTQVGVENIASLLGAVVAGNIFTPIIRNAFAAERQGRYLESLKSSPQMTYLKNRIDKSPTDMNSYMRLNRAPAKGMKI